MTFFDYKDRMKKDPQIKITRALWATPHYFIYWSPLRQVFCEHFGSIDREWASSTIIDDLNAADWKRI